MRVRTIGLILIVTLGALAIACTDETTVLPSDQERPGVSVSGTGSAFGEPDVAVLTIGVEAEAETVAEARAEAAESMNAMIDVFKEGGVADEDIQTTRFSVQPRFDFSKDRQELIGFFVDNIVIVKIRDIDSTGDLIDDGVTAGGDNARVDNLQFTIDDPTALEEEARIAAMEEARAKAETLADAGGVSLGAPLSISETGGPRPIAFEGALAADFALPEGGTTPIETGELEILVNVQVVYALE